MLPQQRPGPGASGPQPGGRFQGQQGPAGPGGPGQFSSGPGGMGGHGGNMYMGPGGPGSQSMRANDRREQGRREEFDPKRMRRF